MAKKAKRPGRGDRVPKGAAGSSKTSSSGRRVGAPGATFAELSGRAPSAATLRRGQGKR